MPYVHTNGVRLSYDRTGQGKTVLLIMGSGAAAHVWDLHQVPALHAAGYETVTFDNRGIPPSDTPPGKYSLADVVADTRGLIEALDLAPCRIVGMSMGAQIAQELAIEHPELVHSAVLMATRARSDALRRAQAVADIALLESGAQLPEAYHAFTKVTQMLSRTTLNDEAAVASWLSIFELSKGAKESASGQIWIDMSEDRRSALRRVSAPCRVIAFDDDLITPPHLAAEVAEAIPDCDFVQLPECGHLGHLERPEAVNAAILEFLKEH
jgi:pimeloyl-ACP methyl ester carboxylesterase